MSVSKELHERPVIYIAAPFRAPHDYARKLNRDRAERAAFECWSAGAVALCPHLNTANFDGALPDQVWLEGDLELLRRCDAIFMCQGWENSKGAMAELAHAAALGLYVVYELGPEASIHGAYNEVRYWATQWLAGIGR